MRRLVFAALIWVAGTVAAFAQCGSQMPGGTICGNKGTALGLSGPLTSPVLGIPGVSQGSLGLAGTGGGTVTLQPSTSALGSSVATLRAGTYNVVGDTLANTFTAAQVITTNATALQAAQTGSVLRIASGDGVSARYEADSYGATAYFSAVVSGGTNASRTALSSGTELGGFNVWGYNGTAFVGPRGAFRCYANQTWTTGANGTYCDIATTPNGATAEVGVIRFENDGGITVPSTVTGGDQGAGTINAGGLYVNGMAVQTAGPSNAQTSAYSLQTSDCGKTVTLGGSAEYALTVGAASGFPALCTVNVVNVDTGRGKVMTINGITFPLQGILWPGMKFTLKNVNNVWTILGLNNLWKITSAVTFNIDTANGVDGNNDCLGAMGTSGACATLANAITQFCQIGFPVGALVTFQTKTGQTHPVQTFCTYQSAELVEEVNNPTVQGDTTSSCANAANFVINGVGSDGIQIAGVPTPWIVIGMEIESTSGGIAIQADNHSRLYLNDVVFPSASTYHMLATYDGFIEIVGNYCVTGGAAVHASSQTGGKILAKPSITLTISNTPAFSVAFAQSIFNGLQEWRGVTFSGSATGVRYSAATGGGIDTNGGGATFLPGNSAGSATSPGWYN